MMGQEGKTASRLQIDIPANVFVSCEKWCRNSHLHYTLHPPSPSPLPPHLLAPPPLSSLSGLLPPSAVVNHALQSISPHPNLYFPLPAILTAPDHGTDLPAFRSALCTWLSFPCCHRNLNPDYCSAPLILYPFLCLGLPGTAFRENDLSEWTINCGLLL